MKIIGTDNHANEAVADALFCQHIPNTDAAKKAAQALCDELNRRLGDGPGTFYQVVDDDRKLWGGMSELI